MRENDSKKISGNEKPMLVLITLLKKSRLTQTSECLHVKKDN
jgi:hypothetical protein